MSGNPLHLSLSLSSEFCVYVRVCCVICLKFFLFLQTIAMTKLLEWISALSALFAVWYSLIAGYVKHPLVDTYMNLILVSPVLFVMCFGVYAVVVVLYRVFTFNNCEEAAKELQAEIVEAKKDLLVKGLKW